MGGTSSQERRWCPVSMRAVSLHHHSLRSHSVMVTGPQLSTSHGRLSWGTQPRPSRSTGMYRHISSSRRPLSRRASSRSSVWRRTVDQSPRENEDPTSTTSRSSLPPALAIETSIKSLRDRIEITIITLQYPGVTLQQMPGALSLFRVAPEVSSLVPFLEGKELLSITTTLTFKRPDEWPEDSPDSSTTVILSRSSRSGNYRVPAP